MKARSVLVLLALLFGDLAPTAIGSPSAPASSDGGGEVRMETGPEITLSGVLTLPHATGPFPAAVLLSDLGTGNQALTARLTHAGVAVLQLDGRGSGKSTGTFLPWMPEITAADALAWVRWLGTRPGIDAQRIGLVGHSQGGVAAAMAAGGNPDPIAFIVLLAAVGVPVEEWQLHQITAALKAGGNRAVTSLELAGLDHEFRNHPSGPIGEGERDTQTIAPKVVAVISDWIRDQTRR